jgi:hypothetical protein
MEIKGIHMTDEYAAHYFLQQGYLAARVEFIQKERERIEEEKAGAFRV